MHINALIAKTTLPLVLILALVTGGCSLFNDNRQDYRKARITEPVNLGENIIPGDIKPIPDTVHNQAVPVYNLPRRPQPSILTAPDKQAENVTYLQGSQKPYKHNTIYTNSDSQPTLRLTPANSLTWQQVGRAIIRIGYTPWVDKDNKYYIFNDQNHYIRIVQIRTPEAIYLTAQNKNFQYLDTVSAERLLTKIQMHL